MLERVSFFSVLASNQYSSFISFWPEAMNKLVEGELQLLIILLWLNWRERNALLHDGNSQPALEVYQTGVVQLQGLREVRSTGESSNRRSSVEIRWLPPHARFKLNCDGASCVQQGHFGGGAIVRDGFGVMVGAVGVGFEHLITLAYRSC